LFSFVAANANTGAATINLNGLGAKSITKSGTTALAANDIVSGRLYLIEYDGTRFQLLNPSSSTGTGASVFATSPTLVTPALGTPSSGNLGSCTADGTNGVGYINIPQNSQSAAYTTVLGDAAKCIFHPSTDANARTFTIAANSSVAYPVGTVIQFCNMTSQVVTIAITTDTMYLAGAGTTGSRSLAQYGVANAMKITSTTWIITGSGLT